MPDAPPVASGWVAAEEDGGAQGGGGIGGDVGGEEGAGPSAAGGEEERGEEGGGGVVGGADGLLTAGAPTVKVCGWSCVWMDGRCPCLHSDAHDDMHYVVP